MLVILLGDDAVIGAGLVECSLMDVLSTIYYVPTLPSSTVDYNYCGAAVNY